MDDNALLAEALDDRDVAQRLLSERPDLAERFCALAAEERLLVHALAPTEDELFTQRVMASVALSRRAPSRRRVPPRFSYWPWSLAAACVACVVLLATRFQPAPPAIAWLDVINGTVSIAEEPVQVGEGLLPDQPLSVAEGGSAILRFADGSLLDIGGGARLAVTNSPEELCAELFRGRITATVTPQPVNRHFTIKCPQVLVRVVGTAFSLNATGNATHLTVQEGKVQAERLSDRSTVMVVPGQSLTVQEGAPFIPHREAPPAVTAKLIGFTLCDAITGKALAGGSPLLDGALIDLGPLPGRPVNIRVEAETSVDEVRFTCDGPKSHHQHREEIAPFYLYGNREERLRPWTPAAGTYHITAIPRGRDGHDGPALTVTFTVRR